MRLRTASSVCGLAALAATGLVGLTASGAGAAPQQVGLDCSAFVAALNLTVPVDGDPNTPGRQPQMATFEVQAPATVEAGTVLTLKLPSAVTQLPDESTGLRIDRLENISSTYKVTGGTIVPGSLSADGPPLIDGVPGTAGTPVVGTDTFTIGTPGPIVPTYVPGAGGGAALTSPNITFQVTVGAVGSVITTTITGTTLTAYPIIGTPQQADTTCTAPPNSLVATGPVILSSTEVVAPPPPPPGAPDAVNDTATTGKDQALTIDVLANDTKSSSGEELDTASLSITTAPTNGTAEVRDGKIVYTPRSGYTGGDSLKYTVCSMLATGGQGPCDTPATVSITVQGEQAAATTTTPVTAAAPATTAAPAAQAELPRTGAATLPLLLAGTGIVAVGLLFASRQRTRSPRSQLHG